MAIVKSVGVIFFFCLTNTVCGQFNYTQQTVDAQMAILDLDFEKFNAIQSTSKPNEAGLYAWLDAYKTFIDYQTSAKSIDSKIIVEGLKGGLQNLEGFKTENPYYYYCKADLYFMLAFMYFDTGNKFNTLNYYLKAKAEVVYNRKTFPNFGPALKHQLLLEGVSQIIDAQWPWGNTTFSGNNNPFFTLITDAQKSENLAVVREVKMLGVLLSSLINGSNDSQLMATVNIDIDYGSIGPIEAYIAATFLQRNEKQTMAFTVLQNAQKLGFNTKLNLLNLTYGNALLNIRQPNAIVFFDAFLKVQKRQKLVNYARFKASEYWFLFSNAKKVDSLVAKISASTAFDTPEDKQANYEISHYTHWNAVLLKARLLFDGGEYHKALAFLLDNKELVSGFTKDQRLEYAYRLGRIYDKLDNVKNAATFYEMAIQSNLDSEYYYPAYAAYYLGMMYQKNNQSRQANNYLQRCLQLDSPIYKASIHKKAHMAISR